MAEAVNLRNLGPELRRQFEDLASRFMASDTGQRVLGWYDTLGDRDRLALRLLGAFLGAVLLYVLILAPAIGQGDRAWDRLQEERALLGWLRAHQGEVSGSGAVQAREQPVATLVNSSAQENKLTIRRYEPAGEDGIRVWLEGAEFNAVVKWLYQLEGSSGIRAVEFTVERDAQPGRVNARLTLQG
jgi:general secretion pathway protein M